MDIKNIYFNKINNYIDNPTKSGWLNWQVSHHHGSTGIKRAKLLKSYINRITNEDDLKSLIDAYESQDSYKVFHILKNLNNRNRLILVDKKDYDQCIKDAEFLCGGNESNSSLRRYLKSKTENTRATYRPSNLHGKIDSLSHNDEYSVKSSSLEKEEKDNVVKSAHYVRKFKKNNTEYYVKNLTNDEQKENAIAEVIYSQLWSYFIGERASKSVLVTDDTDSIVGIASKGIPNFQAYANFKDDTSQPQGIISVLFLSCLLKEQDLHMYNFGKGSFYSESKQKNIELFAKIDHDYIIDKWAQGDNLSEVNPVKVSELADAINNNDLAKFIGISKSIRFSPSNMNNRMLQLCHKLRNKFTDKPDTTTGNGDAHDFLKNVINKQNTAEFNDLITRFKSSLSNDALKEFESNMRELLDEFQTKGYPISKAEDVLSKMLNRLNDFSRQITSTNNNKEVHDLSNLTPRNSTEFKSDSQLEPTNTNNNEQEIQCKIMSFINSRGKSKNSIKENLKKEIDEQLKSSNLDKEKFLILVRKLCENTGKYTGSDTAKYLVNGINNLKDEDLAKKIKVYLDLDTKLDASQRLLRYSLVKTKSELNQNKEHREKSHYFCFQAHVEKKQENSIRCENKF